MHKKIISAILLVTCSLLPLLSQEHSYTLIEDKATLAILTPAFKERSTLKIQLENGLQAYLVSDPSADQSAATLLVMTGSWEDPVEHPGLAHFLEHMLFMGTTKYPDESEYLKFIKENGGETNAFTGADSTGFLFSVNHDALPEALDRFSNFFIDPLFNPSAVERELNAIDQEHAKNRDNESRREYFVLKALANPSHPFHAFSAGNKESLQHVSQETLKQWYQEHYSANRMKLEVVSSLPMDQLKDLVIEKFAPIENKNLPPLTTETKLMPHNFKGHMVYVEPINNARHLRINWELPEDFANMRDTKPEDILGHILQHEGSDGLLAILRKEGLAENLSASGERIGSKTTIFSIEVDLTERGIHDPEAVIMRCFQALAYFKENPIPQHILDEATTMSKLYYQYQQKQDAFAHIMSEAFNLIDENIDTYPEQTKTFRNLDPDAVDDFIGLLTPDSAFYLLTAPAHLLPNVAFDRNEPWMGVAYTEKSLPQGMIDEWNKAQPLSQLMIPPPNPYIPSTSTIVSHTHSDPAFEGRYVPVPTPLIDNGQGAIFFTPDNMGLPMIDWIFDIKTPAVTPADVSSQVMNDIFSKYAQQLLAPETDAAGMAGLNFDVYPFENGISIRIQGFSDKAEKLFVEMVSAIKAIRISEPDFQMIKHRMAMMYINQANSSPLTQGIEALRQFQYQDWISPKAKFEALQKVQYSDMAAFVNRLFDQTYIEGMLVGNIDETNARRVSEALATTIGGKGYPKQMHYYRELSLPKGPQTLEPSSNIQGSVAILSVLHQDTSEKAWAAQQILMQAINQPFFSELRTRQQTGYMVHSRAERLNDTVWNTFAVQSSTHSGKDLIDRFEKFIGDFLATIEQDGVTPETFENIKKSLLDSLKQPPQSLSEMAVLLHGFAFQGDGDFDLIARRIATVEGLRYEEFITFAQQMLGQGNMGRVAVVLGKK